MMNKVFLMALVLGVSLFSRDTNAQSVSSVAASTIDHSTWSAILKANVTYGGNVDYQGIKNDTRFGEYLELLQNNHPSKTWSSNERMAYWINAYNVFTVKLINDNWPVKSIKDIKSPWKQKFIAIGDNTYSLEDIEHNILRKEFNDPRIHFAINCASFSCPKIQNWAFLSGSLDGQLDKVTKAFLDDKDRNVITKESAKLSKIFSWFKSDFTKEGSLIDFINQYSSIKLDEGAKISFLDYNWKLNN